MADQFPSRYPHFLRVKGTFVVKNITDLEIYKGVIKKTIKIFNYPILAGHTCDLLLLEGVSEADIRASLLKGEILHKLKAKEIIIVDSDIDLLQFNEEQKLFLQQSGVVKGLEVTSTIATLNYVWKEKIPLIGSRDGINRTFYTPDKFINGAYYGNTFHITIEHNGKELYENIDFTIGESSGPGTGYDTINLISLTPNYHSLLYATYTIVN